VSDYLVDSSLYAGGDSILDAAVTTSAGGYLEGGLAKMTGHLGAGLGQHIIGALRPMSGSLGGHTVQQVAGNLPHLAGMLTDLWDYGELRGSFKPLSGSLEGGFPQPNTYATLAVIIQPLMGVFTGLTGEIGPVAGDLPRLTGLLGEGDYGEIRGNLPRLTGQLGAGVYSDTSLVYVLDFMIAFKSGPARVWTEVTARTDIAALRRLQALLFSAVTVETPIVALGLYRADARIVLRVRTDISGLSPVGPTLTPGAETWVVNLETTASSRYGNYGFRAFDMTPWGAVGVAEDGLYLLEGADDAGLPVQGGIAMADRSFGTRAEKKIDAVYIGVSADQLLTLKVEADGEIQYYQAKGRTGWLGEQRFTPGKGLVDNFWSFTLLGDAPFEVESIEFNVLVLSRR
jgi:hypothetical protein